MILGSDNVKKLAYLWLSELVDSPSMMRQPKYVRTQIFTSVLDPIEGASRRISANQNLHACYLEPQDY
jgi:hypothetical protein